MAICFVREIGRNPTPPKNPQILLDPLRQFKDPTHEESFNAKSVHQVKMPDVVKTCLGVGSLEIFRDTFKPEFIGALLEKLKK